MIKFNKKISHKNIWLNSMTGMTIGFFATLIVGTVLGLVGRIPGAEFMFDIRKVMGYMVGFGIGVGVGIKCNLNPLQIFSAGLAGMIVSISKFTPNYDELSQTILVHPTFGFNITQLHPGDIFGAWLISVLIVYIFTIFTFRTYFDIFIVPIMGVFIGIVGSGSLSFVTSGIMTIFECLLDKIAKGGLLLNIILAPIIGLSIGLALTMPISSAAITFAIHIHGAPASAALAATAGQAISFAVMTWFSNKSITKTLAVGIGTPMLHMKNYMRSPRTLIIPCIVSMVAALCAASLPLAFDGPHQSVTIGMAVTALYPQMMTIVSHSVSSHWAWIHLIFMQLLIPITLTIGLWFVFKRYSWINEKELQLKHE